MKKKKKDDGFVKVDPRILAAAASEAYTQKQETPNLQPLVSGKGIAQVGEIKVKYNQELDSVEFESAGKCSKLELYQFVFGICDESMREQMMPVRTSEVITFERIHNVQLKKDSKAGSIIRVSCQMNIPVRIEEGLKGLSKTAKQGVENAIDLK